MRQSAHHNVLRHALSSSWQEAYASTPNFLAYIEFLRQRDVLCSTMRQYCTTARAVLGFCNSFVPDPDSLRAKNITDLQSWYRKLSTSCSKIGKRAHSTPSPLHQKVLDPVQMMSFTELYVDNAMGVVEAARTNYTMSHAYHVMLGCMAALTFGYNATPRPGQLLSLVHPKSPTKCSCNSPSCLGNTFIMQINGDLTLHVSHHKNEARSVRPQPPVNIPVGDTLHTILFWWINVGFYVWRAGTITDDPRDISQWYLWCNSEGKQYTTGTWGTLYGDLLEEETGSRMPPNLARCAIAFTSLALCGGLCHH
jgi:hypothetical protein